MARRKTVLTQRQLGTIAALRDVSERFEAAWLERDRLISQAHEEKIPVPEIATAAGLGDSGVHSVLQKLKRASGS